MNGIANPYARVGSSFAPDWHIAVTDAVHDAMEEASTPPDLLIVFIAAVWSDHYQQIIARLREDTGCQVLIGSSSSGVIAGAACHETAAGISLLAFWLPEAELHAVYIPGVPVGCPMPPDVKLENLRGVFLFSDPYRTDAQTSLIELRKTCPGVPMIGGLASTSRADRHAWVFLNDTVYTHGAVAVALEGPYSLVTQVSQGGTPVGETWTITATQRNQVLTISNRPAVDVMHDTLDQISTGGYGITDLMIGFPMDEYRDHFEREDFVARGILGAEVSNGALLIGAIPRQGQSIQFLKRDRRAASQDLAKRLQQFQAMDRQIVGGILSSCKGRGTNMFGRNDHDASAVANALPDVPVVGFYSIGELGPVRDVPAYNAFAAAIGLIVRD